MRSSILLSFAALATAVPTPQFPGLPLGLLNILPKYFENAASGSCSLNQVTLPTSALPAPDAGLTLALVAVGRGTQNYTCASSTSADKPTPNGALANLFNASCLASYSNANDLAMYTRYKEGKPKTQQGQYPLPLIGEHYFVDSTTPSFFLNVLGATELKKNATAPAPNATADVAWLKLEVQQAGTTSTVQNVYRVNTVAVQPPATCDGLQSTFTVEYAADYYFYSS